MAQKERNEEKNTYKRITNVDLRVMFNKSKEIGIFKSGKISWARHIWNANNTSDHKVETRKKRPK